MRCARWLALGLLLATTTASGMEAVMRSQSWPGAGRGFAQCDARIQRMRGRNLLGRQGVKLFVQGEPAHATTKLLVDGTAGVWVGTGRVGLNGKPAVLNIYLGQAKPISQVAVFTSNSDARVNQDYEVRFANNTAQPGKVPTFPKEPALTTGSKVVGPNAGCFLTYFRAVGGGAMTKEPVDWVQFRFWPTYPAAAGTPAKDATAANSWTSLVELEVWGDEGDAIWIPDDDFAKRDAMAEKALAQGYEKKQTWQDTFLAAQESIAKILAEMSGTPGFKPYVSGALRAGRKTVKIDVSVAGLPRVWLETAGAGAVWGDPVLIDKAGKATPLTDRKPLFVDAGKSGISIDKAAKGKALAAGGRAFDRGLLVPADSRVCYKLDGKAERLAAEIGAVGRRGNARVKVLSLPSGNTDTLGLVWQRVQRDFADAESQREMAWETEDRIWASPWPHGDRKTLAARYAAACRRLPALQREAVALANTVSDDAGLAKVRALHHRSRRVDESLAKARTVQWKSLRLAVDDLTHTFGDRYPRGAEFLKQIDAAEAKLAKALEGTTGLSGDDVERLEALANEGYGLYRTALLANPLLTFDKLLLVKRRGNRLGLPANWQSNSSTAKTGYDNAIMAMSISAPEKGLTAVYSPPKGEYVGDVDLHYDAGKMLFSMPEGNGAWHVWEVGLDGQGLRKVTHAMDPAVNNYDACYLPDERIIFTSTAGMVAVPCVNGSAPVATLFRMNADGTGIRQLCFDQEHSWYPAVMHDGRVLYTRWEYADLPHSNSRMLFTTNPDGTNQRAYYGSGSFWPNSIFYARPIPGHATKVVGTVTGHHAPARMGELIIFDPGRGSQEADGVVQRIPGYGKPVEALIQDGLTGGSWPKFLHPWPLNEHYFLVSAKLNSRAQWGIYLVDVFDNMLPILVDPAYALLEPFPLTERPRPPVIPDRVDLKRDDAVILISDIYAGPGLKGIPRGEVKRLRLYTYTFGYNGMGGLYGSIGMDGPWDMRRILGTAPVAADGSAVIRVPANTPIAVQPLDSEGKALQIMRSWFTAMPGETLSCIGCHENLNDAPPNVSAAQGGRPPAEIEPWYGPARNYEFQREVQPVLDKFCVGCHGASGEAAPQNMVMYKGQAIPDLRGTVMLKGWSTRMHGRTGVGGRFSVAYGNLHRYVRRPGIESPMPLMTPMEFHADTTELVQHLAKGHHSVKLDAEAWDRLVTWIDLNAPYHGRWSTIVGEKAAAPREEQRAKLRSLYANVEENHEVLPEPSVQEITPIIPTSTAPAASALRAEARVLGKRDPAVRTVDLGDDLTMEFVHIPAGEFAMGSVTGYPDEAPMAKVRIAKDFWMGRFEVTNEQFRRFDITHDSREEDRHGYQFGIPGYNVNGDKLPACRLSWRQAVAFCDWLSKKTGKRVALPTEAQWEWACRAGTDTPFSYGDLDTDFSPFANMGDITLSDFSGNPYKLDPKQARYGNPENIYDNWIPQDGRFNDKGFVSEVVGKYKPNPWGLHDMHGNVAEWTLSLYKPYPYEEGSERNSLEAKGKRVVRGGSWYDRPKRCTSSYRYGYRDYQKVFNVGFRVVMEP